MRRIKQGMIPLTAFASAALTLALLCSGGNAESAFTLSGSANMPLWLTVGFLAFAAGLVARETDSLFRSETPGPWIPAMTAGLPAAMAIATLAGKPVAALAFELAAALGLLGFLAERQAAATHRRHPGPRIAFYAACILACGAAAELLGHTGFLPAELGGALHATSFRAFLLLIAIAALRWSGSTGLRTGLTPFAAARLRISLFALLASFLIDACAGLGWLGAYAYAISSPIRLVVLARMRMPVPGILPMLPMSRNLARGLRLGLILEIAALGTGMLPGWQAWKAEELLHLLASALMGAAFAFGLVRAAAPFTLPSIRIRPFSVRGIIPAFLRRIA